MRNVTQAHSGNLVRSACRGYRYHQGQLNTARDNLAATVRDATAAGMSQSEAARIVGVDRLTIRKWIA